MNKRIASAVVGASLVLGLSACTDKASDDFKARCDNAKGEVMRESETLGMDAVAFVVKGGKSGGSKSSSKSRSSKSSKSKSKSKSSGKLSGGHSKPKKSKTKKHDDDEWVCARNGVELFEEN